MLENIDFLFPLKADDKIVTNNDRNRKLRNI